MVHCSYNTIIIVLCFALVGALYQFSYSIFHAKIHSWRIWEETGNLFLTRQSLNLIGFSVNWKSVKLNYPSKITPNTKVLGCMFFCKAIDWRIKTFFFKMKTIVLQIYDAQILNGYSFRGSQDFCIQIQQWVLHGLSA